METELNSIRVVYDSLVFFKIMHWVKEAGKDEISGFGKVIYKDGVYRVVEAVLLPQKNGAAHTEIDGVDVARAEFQLKDAPGEMRLWWHSHVKMGCFWSAQDIETIELLGRPGWILATVFNQHWQKRSAVYYGGDIKVFVDELDTTHIYHLKAGETEPWDAEFKKNVTDHKPTVMLPPAHTGRRVRGEWDGIHFRHVGEEASRAWLNWRKKALTKRERKMTMEKDPVVAVFETETYGRVYWRKSDCRTTGCSKYLARLDKVQILTEVRWFDFAPDIKEIVWTDNYMAQRCLWAAESSYATSPVLKAFKALYDGEEEDESEQAPLAIAGNSDETPDADEDFFARHYPQWDELDEEDREILRAEWREQWATGEN